MWTDQGLSASFYLLRQVDALFATLDSLALIFEQPR